MANYVCIYINDYNSTTITLPKRSPNQRKISIAIAGPHSICFHLESWSSYNLKGKRFIILMFHQQLQRVKKNEK